MIGNKDNVTKSLQGFNAGFAKELKSADFGSNSGLIDAEQCQNPRANNVASDGNIVAIGTEATKTYSQDTKSTFEEGATFLINHGAGHNANLNHAGEDNGYDDQGKYQENGVYVPGTPNVMTDGGIIVSRVQSGRFGSETLQTYVTSPKNQQPANSVIPTLSILQAYIRRFGNNTPSASLPVEQ